MAEFRVVKFEARHIEMMDEQDATRHVSQFNTPEMIESLVKFPSYTGLAGDVPMVCAGVVEFWPGRGEAWAYLARDAKPYFLAIHNAAKQYLRNAPFRRIEAVVDYEHREGHRWVEALGFKCEAPVLRKYGVTGRDCTLYARVK